MGGVGYRPSSETEEVPLLLQLHSLSETGFRSTSHRSEGRVGLLGPDLRLTEYPKRLVVAYTFRGHGRTSGRKKFYPRSHRLRRPIIMCNIPLLEGLSLRKLFIKQFM